MVLAWRVRAVDADDDGVRSLVGAQLPAGHVGVIPLKVGDREVGKALFSGRLELSEEAVIELPVRGPRAVDRPVTPCPRLSRAAGFTWSGDASCSNPEWIR